MSDIQEEQKRLYRRTLENDIKLLQKENKKLKELCDKYEEEHKTTFEEWKKDIKANKKAVEYIETIRNNTPSTPRKDIARMILLREDMLLNILKGDNK